MLLYEKAQVFVKSLALAPCQSVARWPGGGGGGGGQGGQLPPSGP